MAVELLIRVGAHAEDLDGGVLVVTVQPQHHGDAALTAFEHAGDGVGLERLPDAGHGLVGPGELERAAALLRFVLEKHGEGRGCHDALGQQPGGSEHYVADPQGVAQGAVGGTGPGEPEGLLDGGTTERLGATVEATVHSAVGQPHCHGRTPGDGAGFAQWAEVQAQGRGGVVVERDGELQGLVGVAQ